MSGTLWIVATPIGNLGDLSLRAAEVLGEVDVIAAEDTRHSKRLLSHLGISRPMLSYHDHNERERADQLIERLKGGESVALISDAGTPLISDPGYRVVAAAHEAGVRVTTVPGPCAAIAALSVSGLPSDRFRFEGFLPAKSEARKKRLQALAGETATIIFYESGQRMIQCLDDIEATVGEKRPAVVVREMTKQFETVLSGNAGQLRLQIEQDPNQQRGEFVVLVAGASDSSLGIDARSLLSELLGELPASKAAKLAARITGENRQALFDLAESLKAER